MRKRYSGNAGFEIRRKYSVGTDLDPCAIEATYENMEVNGINKDMYEVMIGNIIDDKDVQDKLVMENMTLSLQIFWRMFGRTDTGDCGSAQDGGIYITSGIIDDKEETVVEAVKAAGLEVLEVTYQGEWVSVTARKNG